jgi:hypothetical protein
MARLTFTQTLDSVELKYWLSECGNYRVAYINSLPECNNLRDHRGKFVGYRPAFYAQVLKRYGDRMAWSHANKNGTFRSLVQAERACRANRRAWVKFLKAGSAEEARAMIAMSVVGRTRNGRKTHVSARLLNYPPAWVMDLAPRRLSRYLPGMTRPRRTKLTHA